GPRLTNVGVAVGRGERAGGGAPGGRGRAALSLALCGARRSQGHVVVNGRRVHFRSPSQALAGGVALVPEDRASEGLCLALSVRDNISLGNLGRVSSASFISARRERQLVRSAVNSLHIALRHSWQEANS